MRGYKTVKYRVIKKKLRKGWWNTIAQNQIAGKLKALFTGLLLAIINELR